MRSLYQITAVLQQDLTENKQIFGWITYPRMRGEALDSSILGEWASKRVWFRPPKGHKRRVLYSSAASNSAT